MSTTPTRPAFDPDELQTLASIFDTPFDQLPSTHRVQAFGVDYAHIHTQRGGDLYMTRYGWPHARQLMPINWYADQYFCRHGQRLPDSTGHVYYVSTKPIEHHRSVEIVVKFSRVGQEVPLEIATTFPDDVKPEEIATARFNSPMEEFSMMMELRQRSRQPGRVPLLTQKPLAIYVPPQEFELWRTGRTHSRFRSHQRRLKEDQQENGAAIQLDIRRDYMMIFQWIKGINAVQAMKSGQIKSVDFHALLPRAIEELRAAGFRVLDNKPTHLILRQHHRKPGMVQRHGHLTYGLVDFELLQHTEAHHQEFKHAQRERYWSIQSKAPEQIPAEMPPGLTRVKVLGVDYVYGKAPNGGLIWAVGKDPALFDFFLTDRWRRTPRVKLALTHEVYRTRTRDNIHVVYRQSRVGERPHMDPFYEAGKRIREYGYNSPFEEVAIAESLRKAGLTCIHPRAIYRTGHESVKAGYLLDNRRYRFFEDLHTPPPSPERILSPNHDYYVIWGHWRGVDPQGPEVRAGRLGFIDLRKAMDDGVITRAEHDRTYENIQNRLLAAGFLDTSRGDDEYLLTLDHKRQIQRDAQGDFKITLSADALTVYDYGLIDEAGYRAMIQRAENKIRHAGCEPLNLSGNHLLLSLNPDGVLRTNEIGKPLMCLCNFELIRMDTCRLDHESFTT